LEVIVMAYVAPTIRSVGDAVTAADYNIMANDVISHESRMGLQSIVPASVAVSSGSATTSTNGSVTFTSISSGGTVLLNGVFSSAYTNYRVIVRAAAATGEGNMLFRLAAAGTPSTASDYFNTLLYVVGATVYGDTGGAVSYFGLNATSKKNLYYSVDFVNPFVAIQTVYMGQSYMVTDAGLTGILLTGMGTNKATTSYDGIQIVLQSQTFSGEIVVYGYNK
jgi:hypothetical protein